MSRKSILLVLLVVACSFLAWQTGLATWQATTNLPLTELQMGGSAYHNGYVYHVSGNDYGVADTMDVYYAPINPDGTIGTWNTTEAVPQSQTYIRNAVEVYNGYIYSASGWSYDADAYSGVYYAPINGDGTLGTWVDAGLLPQFKGGTVSGTDCHTACVYNGYLYVAGGENDPAVNIFDEIYISQLQGDGSLGTWDTSSSTLPKPIWFVTMEPVDGYMYVLGGLDASGASSAMDSIYSAPINASDGSIGSWTLQATTLPAVAYGQNSCVVGNDIYLLGGRDNTAAGLDVFWKVSVSGGTVTGVDVLDSFPATTTYATAGTIWYSTMCSDGSTGRIYVLGGRTGAVNGDGLTYPDEMVWLPPATPTPTPSPTPEGYTAVESGDWMLYE